MVTVALPPGATVADLRKALASAYPALAGLVERCAVAISAEFANDADLIPPAADTALLPPVSGG